jgi:hypothetical protein
LSVNFFTYEKAVSKVLTNGLSSIKESAIIRVNGGKIMEDLPKVTKAEMLPGVRLRLEFDNGQVRYYPVHEQIDLLMNPFDVSKLKKTYGANLFLGGMVSWIGNEIKIEPNGDLLLNKSVIPAEMLWKHSLKHVDSLDPEKLKELEEIKHPIWQGFKSLNLIFWIAGILFVIYLLIQLLGHLGLLTS